MVIDLIDERTPPSEVSDESAGRKGCELVQLAAHSASGAFRVPRFRIVPTALSRDFHAEHGFPTPSFPDLPAAHHVPRGAERHYRRFSGRYADDLARHVAGFDGGRPVVLRSSVAAAVPAWASMAGVSFNVHGVPAHPDRVGAACTRLLAAAWRPYAEWYLSRHRPAMARDVAFMVCQLIDLTVAGTAYLRGDVADLEFGRAAPAMPVRTTSLRLADPGHRWNGWWARCGRGDRLRVALAELASRLDPGPAPVEVEFGFDAADGLVFFQYRAMTGLGADGCGIPPRQRAGRVRGPLVSLLDLPRTGSVVERAMMRTGDDRIWVVHQADDAAWDAFALLWYMSRNHPDSRLRIVSCFDPLPRRTHLLAAMYEDPTIEFVAQLPTGTVRPLLSTGAVTIRNDGVEGFTTHGRVRPAELEGAER
jgi:hypothetical protein